MAMTLSILNRFSNSLTAGNNIKFPTKFFITAYHTFSMLPQKLEVQICGNLQKKQPKNRVSDKNWNVSCHMADYCHNSCSKCPPFARTRLKTSMLLVNCTVNDCLVNAMPNMQRTLLQFISTVHLRLLLTKNI